MSQPIFDRTSVVSWIFFAGWFLLPVAFYDKSEIARTHLDGYYWVMGVALPFYFIVTKASMTSLIALAWGMCKSKTYIFPKRLHWLDLGLIVFILSPFLSVYKGNTVFITHLESAIYLAVVWGTPYIFGRVLISSQAKLIASTEVFVIISLIGSPFFLIEFFTSPIFYEYIYGFHPFSSDGEIRYVNFRPMLLLEDGNQLGMWYSTSALLAFGYWRLSNKRKILFLKTSYAHHYSLFILILSQSRGAIILYIIGVSLMMLIICIRKKLLFIYVMLALIVLTATPLLFAKQIYTFAKHNPIGQKTVYVIKEIGGASFTWRIGNDLRNAKILRENFIAGSGSLNWNKDGVRSWGAILLILGAYGVGALFAWSLLLLYPLVLSLNRFDQHGVENEAENNWIILVVAAAIFINWADAFLNSFFISSLLIWVGSVLSINTIRPRLP